jgi:hypothetical protein
MFSHFGDHEAHGNRQHKNGAIDLGIRPIENPKTSFSYGPLTTCIFER